MITKEYRGIDVSKNKNKFFIISSSKDQLYKELDIFVKEHATDDNCIWFFEQPVKPSKVNLRPEYSMEVLITEKDYNSIIIFYKRIH